MTKEHLEQLRRLTEQLDANSKKLDYNNNLTEKLAQNLSALGSDLKAFKLEMKPWIEAKGGINMLGRILVSVPILVATLLGLKTLLAWIGFHK